MVRYTPYLHKKKLDVMVRYELYLLLAVCVSIDAQTVLDVVKPYLPTTPVILEAGAFDGYDSYQMSLYWPQGVIHAFEPIPELYKKLVRLKMPYNNVTFYPVALGDHIGKATMYLSTHTTDSCENFASSSLLEPKEHLTYAPYILFNDTIQVPLTTLDAWAEKHGVDHIDFMWLDMQGYELPALMSGLTLLATTRVIVLEVEFVEAYKGQYLFDDVKLFLEKHGFKFMGLVANYGWCGDALFVRCGL